MKIFKMGDMCVANKFQSGKIYTFWNVAHKNCLDVYDGLLVENMAIRTWPGNGTPAQMWRAETDDWNPARKGHKLVTAIPSNVIRCITQKSVQEHSKCFLNGFIGGSEQYWVMIPVPENNAYQIINMYSGKALTANGPDETVRTTIADTNDLNQQWIVTEL